MQRARDEAKALWDRHPAGTTYVTEEWGTPEFYERMRSVRYGIQPWHPAFLSRFKGSRLLEVGCGAGTDLAELSGNFGYSVGIDLTEGGAGLARGALRYRGRDGSTLVADAESMPFPDALFDLVYSFGVLHHTDHPEDGIREIHRVLKPGGRAVVGLYHKYSLYPLLIFVRFVLSGSFLHERWEDYPGRYEGAASVEGVKPRTLFYSRRSARALFSDFAKVRIRTVHHWHRIPLPGPLYRAMSTVFGWYVMVEAVR